jgi:hypothetical protein
LNQIQKAYELEDGCFKIKAQHCESELLTGSLIQIECKRSLPNINYFKSLFSETRRQYTRLVRRIAEEDIKTLKVNYCANCKENKDLSYCMCCQCLSKKSRKLHCSCGDAGKSRLCILTINNLACCCGKFNCKCYCNKPECFKLCVCACLTCGLSSTRCICQYCRSCEKPRFCPVTIKNKIWLKPYIIYICNNEDPGSVNENLINEQFVEFKSYFEGYSLIWVDYKELCVKKVGKVVSLKNILDVVLDCFKIRTELSTLKTDFDNKLSTLKKDLETELGKKLKAEFDEQFSTLKKTLEQEFQQKLSSQKTEFGDDLSGVIAQLKTIQSRFDNQNVGQSMDFNSIFKLTLDIHAGDHHSKSQIVNQDDNVTKGKII